MKASYAKHTLRFNFTARTSRAVMTEKETYFLRLTDETTGLSGIGECGLFRGLSADDRPNYEEKLADLCRCLTNGDKTDLTGWSSLKFGLETAAVNLENGGGDILFRSDFTEGRKGLPINGLVWMDSIENMTAQIERKIADGFRCIKLKIGQHDFNRELEMIDRLRLRFGPEELEIRLDANGAYGVDEALDVLRRIAPLDVHSVEQPIKAGHWDQMAYLCENSPQHIALDEELIGLEDPLQMQKMLRYIAPEYIILKPTLCGGLTGAQTWIEIAERLHIGWWVTSALESNVGLNALAQWTAAMGVTVCQGLGTGMLYTNNIPSPLSMAGGELHFDPNAGLDTSSLQWTDPA